jgi:bleomycin hydrolase
MGANQSKQTLPSEKLLIEQLRAIEVRDKNDFVLIDEVEKATTSTTSKKFKAPWVSLSVGDLKGWETELLKDSKNRSVRPVQLKADECLTNNSLALTALSSADPKTVLTSKQTFIKDQQIFNVKIPFEGAPITNQRSSGRCWLFAATNVFRVALMKYPSLLPFVILWSNFTQAS